jgi:hypothetical protein
MSEYERFRLKTLQASELSQAYLVPGTLPQGAVFVRLAGPLPARDVAATWQQTNLAATGTFYGEGKLEEERLVVVKQMVPALVSSGASWYMLQIPAVFSVTGACNKETDYTEAICCQKMNCGFIASADRISVKRSSWAAVNEC